jgi:hypothetical protein
MDRLSAARTEPVWRGPWCAHGREDSNGLRARRMGKGHASPGMWPWVARGAWRGRRGRPARGRARRRDAAAFRPKRVANPLFKIEKLQNFV